MMRTFKYAHYIMYPTKNKDTGISAHYYIEISNRSLMHKKNPFERTTSNDQGNVDPLNEP